MRRLEIHAPALLGRVSEPLLRGIDMM